MADVFDIFDFPNLPSPIVDFDDLPDPIDPNTGEQNLLDIINGIPLNDIYSALDRFPVPFTVIAQAGDSDPVVANWMAGIQSLKLNVDNDKATGKGNSGDDLEVRVSTELVGTPHLKLDIGRLQDKNETNFAEDVKVLIAFPFDAFNDEILPGAPNLFMGFQTRAAGGGEGGYVPLYETIELIPGLLGGTDHTFDMNFNTTGADNPLEFLLGAFDGTNLTGVLNGEAMSALVETADHSVPDTINVGLDVFNILSGTGTDFGLEWNASEVADVRFKYVEDEDVSNGMTGDFGTTIAFDSMPTSESLTFSMTDNPHFNFGHRGSDVINSITLVHERKDGMMIIGRATDVPTAVDLSVDTDASTFALDVNANTLDMQVELIKDGGFLNSQALLGFDLGYLSVGFENAPDLQGGFDAANGTFNVMATNAGESIDRVFAIADDDAHYTDEALTNLVGLELPPSWNDEPLHHIFSWIENGAHGTVAARLVNLEQAALNLNAATIAETYTIKTTEAAPLQAYLNFGEDSNVIPGDNEEIEITIDVDVIPAGEITFNYEAPIKFSYETDPPAGIDSVHIFGHIGPQNFDVAAGDLPAKFEFEFDPAGLIEVLAEDGFGGSDPVGFLAARLWNEEGMENTSSLFGDPLQDARMRVDDLPTSVGTWQVGSPTEIVFDTDPDNKYAGDEYLGGIQFEVSTAVEFEDPLAEATSSSAHYNFFEQEDNTNVMRMGAGAFGIDTAQIEISSLILHYVADSQRVLTVDIDRSFGGPFFPAGADYDYDLNLTVDAIPQQFDFSSNLTNAFNYTASHEIDELTLSGVIDTTNDSEADGTQIDFELLGLPSEVNFTLTPSSGATLTMNDQLDSIALSMESINDVDPNAIILGGIAGLNTGNYRLINMGITNVAEKVVADWKLDADGVRLEATDETGTTPQPLGVVSALVSTSNDDTVNAGKIEPFTLNGPVQNGPILGGTSDGSRISYSEFTQEIDHRYYSPEASTVFSRLQDLYADSEELDNGEDHVIVRNEGGSVDFASFQFTGFQKISWDPDANGGEFIFRAPTIGAHPLFAGVEDDDVYTTLQIENVPDEMIVDIDKTGSITYDATDSAGEIDLYQGPAVDGVGLLANDGDEAIRAIMKDTPSEVDLTWNIGFPSGNANFTASNPFELLFLSQDSGQRITAGLELQNLGLSYGIGFPLSLDIDGPEATLEPPFVELGSADLRVFEANATFTANPGIDGFFALYDLVGSPANLTGGIAPSGAEYVPQITTMVRNFEELSLTAALDIELATIDLPFIPTFTLEPEIDFDIDLTGDFVFDVWATSDLSASFDIGDFSVGFHNPADYINNSPFHILPLSDIRLAWIEDLLFGFDGFHEFDDHFEPYDS